MSVCTQIYNLYFFLNERFSPTFALKMPCWRTVSPYTWTNFTLHSALWPAPFIDWAQEPHIGIFSPLFPCAPPWVGGEMPQLWTGSYVIGRSEYLCHLSRYRDIPVFIVVNCPRSSESGSWGLYPQRPFDHPPCSHFLPPPFSFLVCQLWIMILSCLNCWPLQ